MSNIPISDDLAKAFQKADESTRAILVQNDGGFLKLVETAPPSDPNVSDKEDFLPVLSKLFSNDPQRSGYALYRLDSQSASGEWEWLCCSYQPDGAKIKEKMQYAITRSSLMAGLTERNFLETIFGATPRDFLWPTKLRNSRKHDYQNPQLKTAGISAAEAAGTGVGGARRNFGSVRSSNAKTDDVSQSSDPSATSGSQGVQTTGLSSDTQPSPPPLKNEAELPTLSPTSAPTPKRYNSHEFTSAFKSPSPPAEDQQGTTASIAAAPEMSAQTSSSSDQRQNEQQFAAEAKAPEEPSTPAIAVGSESGLSQPTVPAESSLNSAAEVVSAEDALSSEPVQCKAEQEFAESKAPQEPPTPVVDDDTALSKPTLPTSLEQASIADATPAETTQSTPSQQQEKSRISIGSGAGISKTGLTQREEELAELRKLQASERASSNGAGLGSAGGPDMGFKWSDGVQEAIQSLASTASGTSEWNLVVLSIDVRSERVELESPPRFILPADLPTALSDNEPRIAFYRLDDAAFRTGGESVVAMLYCCPASSGVKARMIYSSNVLTILNHVKGFSGMRVVKKLEASDRADLSHAYVAGEIEDVLAQERHKFAGTGFDSVERAPESITKTGFTVRDHPWFPLCRILCPSFVICLTFSTPTKYSLEIDRLSCSIFAMQSCKMYCHVLAVWSIGLLLLASSPATASPRDRVPSRRIRSDLHKRVEYQGMIAMARNDDMGTFSKCYFVVDDGATCLINSLTHSAEFLPGSNLWSVVGSVRSPGWMYTGNTPGEDNGRSKFDSRCSLCAGVTQPFAQGELSGTASLDKRGVQVDNTDRIVLTDNQDAHIVKECDVQSVAAVKCVRDALFGTGQFLIGSRLWGNTGLDGTPGYIYTGNVAADRGAAMFIEKCTSCGGTPNPFYNK
ncbi:actin depolymerizing protein [Testicularia cyperi]|uniref:Actin depolymerizing protein n=1 Tax=Testicularia cyperi TaxID=1882483 RepID=A0A317XH77_9BASI|nr:actin depolymerizing protein [Testicularia cyperi]